MKEDYAITIRGRQVYEDEDQGEICLSALGTYREKDGTRFILYKEYDEDNASAYRTALLKVEPGMVTMSRSGSPTRLILEKGRRHLCLYDTGLGRGAERDRGDFGDSLYPGRGLQSVQPEPAARGGHARAGAAGAIEKHSICKKGKER